MKVFIKRLNGTKFNIQVKPDHTVADVKKIIETVQGENVYPAARQMLIHQGKILKDGTSLMENNVAENSVIVMMVSPNKSSSSSGEASTSATIEKVGIPEQGELPSLGGALAESSTSDSKYMADNWSIELEPDFPQSWSTSAAAPNKLDFLRDSRRFEPLRAMMRFNPRTIEPILDEVMNHYPEVVDLIYENYLDFLRLLYEPLEGSENSDSNEVENHPRNSLSVDSSLPIWTNEESLAIARLAALGFKNLLVSELFYACDRDEEETTSFLLNHLKFED